ncbi:hypothetical protein FC093_21975 [Ilyomonas limi]|uniref:Uncharacterized protein n=1 Tax=Ilyomonas limi TaxID=2575867 RepID=A0A4U3KSR2_9BACT|nr:hypothetical protein [Ilyomonas limi]TKK64719.1 hypothetical protein FC093_21975 [Ilyomonas limi]
MKHLIIVAATVLFFFSCKKDEGFKAVSVLQRDEQFFNTVQQQLKDSLSASDYSHVNFSQVFKSKNAQGNYYFVRIGLLHKSMATDFILLQTDSLGNVKGGKLIHVDKEQYHTRKHQKFNGRFVISTLNRQYSNIQEVTNGRWKVGTGATAMAKPADEQEEPAGEQTLPDVVVTSYTDADTGMDWYWYDGLYFGGSGTGGSDNSGGYTYGPASGSGSSNNTVTEDNTIIIEIEPNDESPIKVEDYIKCFSTVSDVNATYKITIFSDLPVNGDPSKIFDWSTNSPGHSFVQLSKSGGGQSIQQNFGFYPEFGWKAPANVSIDSKVVDNAGHEFNASLTLTVNNSQFQAALNKVQAIAGYDYNITTWNCTDFALSVFNAASSSPLTIPQFPIPTSTYPLPTTVTLSNTPQGLYYQIQALQASGNTSYGTADVPGVCGYAGGSHGSCN